MVSEVQSMVGHSQFFDENYQVVLNNGFYLKTIRGEATIGITGDQAKSSDHPIHTENVMCVWLVKTMMAMLRDRAGVTVIEEIRRFQGVVCPDCGGQGGNDDDDGNWVICPNCREDGMV